MKRFSDFAEEPTAIMGEKIRINDLLGKEIEVTGHKISDSKHKAGTKLLTLQFKLDDEERILFTGSNVLIEQAERYESEMPFLTTVQKVNKFYTFT